MRKPVFLFTCEHSRFAVPPSLRGEFSRLGKVLRSHRGWDEGAARIADYLGNEMRAPVIHGKYSRLVVDLNRTADHPNIFSEWTAALPDPARKKLIHRIHGIHWDKVRREVARRLRKGHQVVHVGVHSFVPVLHGQRRKTDIGLLFDPARTAEAEFCRRVKHSLKRELDLAVHFNLPYRGTGNGLVTELRKEFSKQYLGIELEINQRLLPKLSREISRALAQAFKN